MDDTFSMSKTIRETIILILIGVVFYIGLRFSIQKYIVYMPSMQPNFVEHQQLMVNKLIYKFTEPQRGDVIIFRPPLNEQTSFIKRIIGLPGESIEVKNHQVYVYKTDGTILILNEPYIIESIAHDYTKHNVPDNQYFVMGDNRNNSNDSRSGWTVPRENIIGKAWLSIWPPDRWGLALNYAFPNQTAQASSK